LTWIRLAKEKVEHLQKEDDKKIKNANDKEQQLKRKYEEDCITIPASFGLHIRGDRRR